MNPERITYFAETDARSKRVPFGIKSKDRTRHVYVIGKTGMGKSTLLENMAVQDIKNGEGMAFIDPHGKTAELLLEYIPPERMKDVLYFAPFDTDYPISFNVLEQVDPDKRHLVVSGLMSTFKKIWQDAWSARMEYILTNTLLALLEYPGATLLGVNRMLAEKDFRKDVIDHITDVSVKNFWVKEFANYTERMAAEAVPAIQNKIGQFTANALIRNMIGQPTSSFDIREMMDNKKILIINLSKGKIGESNANLLGGMLITKIYLAAMSRADLSNRVMATMPNFYLFVDEFQSFANESFADILSEARKYHLNLTIAHQYIEQMEEEVRAAVFGNVGTMIIFRVGAYDAEVLEKEFAPTFTAEDIVNLGQYQIYLKLMIDGISSQPFSATNLPPIKPPEVDHVAEVLAASREQFAHKRDEVEAAIETWHKPIVRTPPTPVAPKSAPMSAPTNMAQPSQTQPVQFQPAQSVQRSVSAPAPVVQNPSPVPAPVSAPVSSPAPIQNPAPAAHVAAPSRTTNHPPVSIPNQVPRQRTAPAPGSIAAAITAAMAVPVPARQPAPAAHEPHFQQKSQTHIHPTVNIPAQPKPQPKPVFEQPFKEALKNVQPSNPVKAETIKTETVSQSVAPVTTSPAPTPITPVPLSTLAKNSGKNDQKTPTPKNINDLKNTLAAVMGSAAISQPQTPKKTEEAKPVHYEHKTHHDHKDHKEPKKEDQKEDMSVPTKEVPKDILEKILK